MQQKTPSTWTFIALIVIVVIAIGLYFYFKGSPTEDAFTSLETEDTPELIEVRQVGGKVLSLLNEINSLKINDSLFEASVYKSLIDYTITIPELPIGKDNPFAPIAGLYSK